MANVTVAIDEDVLRRARIRALEAGTSVNALVRAYLESYVGSAAMHARHAIVDHADQHATRAGARSWTRQDLHER